MVIHIGASEAAVSSGPFAQLVDQRAGREMRLGKRLIGWNLSDTIVLRSHGLTQLQIQKCVRHFSTQRHVVFADEFSKSKVEPYIALAREASNYLFAFVEPSLAQGFPQPAFKERILRAGCHIVTLRPARTVQQIEALLLSAPLVLGSYEPLVMPQLSQARTRAGARKAQKAA